MAAINTTLLYDVARVLDTLLDITIDLIRKCNAAEPKISDEKAKRIWDCIYEVYSTNDLSIIHEQFDKIYKELADGANDCETVDKWYTRAAKQDKRAY